MPSGATWRQPPEEQPETADAPAAAVPVLHVKLPHGTPRVLPPVAMREPRWVQSPAVALPAELACEMAGAMGDRYDVFIDAVGHEPIYAQWPATGDNASVEYAQLPSRFTHRTAGEEALRTLSSPPSDVLDRLELVRLVAVGLDARHHAGLMSSGLSLESIVWTDSPVPSIGFVDHDGLRQLGGEFLGVPSHDLEPDGFDRDRRDYGAIVQHLLSPSGSFDPYSPPRWFGLSDAACVQVARLLRRCEGPPGTRPTMSAWREVWGT